MGGPTLTLVMHARQSEDRRSRRTGRLPRGVYNAQREMTNRGYSEAMQATRKQIATELYSKTQNCVAKLRLQQGMSQQQLADAAGINQPHIAKIESGKLSIRLSTAIQIADALGVDLNQLRPLVRIAEDDPVPAFTLATL